MQGILNRSESTQCMVRSMKVHSDAGHTRQVRKYAVAHQTVHMYVVHNDATPRVIKSGATVPLTVAGMESATNT